MRSQEIEDMGFEATPIAPVVADTVQLQVYGMTCVLDPFAVSLRPLTSLAETGAVLASRPSRTRSARLPASTQQLSRWRPSARASPTIPPSLPVLEISSS